MVNKNPLSDGDLVLLLEKKISLLAELFQLAQKQLPLSEAVALDRLLDEKDQCLDALNHTDAIITMWHEQYPRDHSERELRLLQRIQTGLEDILDLEQQFEKKLEQEKSKISGEMGQLRNRSQLRNYLGTRTSAGKNLSFRR